MGFQYNLPQCLRCLSNIQNNKPCTCKQCSDCLIYCAPNQPHINCSRNKIYCAVCDNGIISSSRLCLYCENKKQKAACSKCPKKKKKKKSSLQKSQKKKKKKKKKS